MADSIRANYAGVVPTGEGTVWTSKEAARSNLLGTFIPYIWVGGPERGLCWFASNDRDWVVDPSDQTPALALERHNGIADAARTLDPTTDHADPHAYHCLRPASHPCQADAGKPELAHLGGE